MHNTMLKCYFLFNIEIKYIYSLLLKLILCEYVYVCFLKIQLILLLIVQFLFLGSSPKLHILCLYLHFSISYLVSYEIH